MRRAMLTAGAVCLGLSALAMPSAFAATKAPGLLQPGDLPGSFQQTAAPIPYTQTSALAVDAKACTETVAPIAAPITGVQASFARVGALPNTLALIEAVQSYPTTKAAATTFKSDSKYHAARLKCGTVGFIPPGSTAPTGSTPYQTAKFPKTGAHSYYESSGTPGTVNTNASVTFLSGRFVVRLGTFGGTDPIGITDLKTIAKKAVKRLPIPTPVPPPTTTAPK